MDAKINVIGTEQFLEPLSMKKVLVVKCEVEMEYPDLSNEEADRVIFRFDQNVYEKKYKQVAETVKYKSMKGDK